MKRLQSTDPFFSSDFAADLTEGILDPFPLLLAGCKAPHKRGPSKFANPLLLVTERKGTAYSLHYAAFPLDAFHTGGLKVYRYAYTRRCARLLLTVIWVAELRPGVSV